MQSFQTLQPVSQNLYTSTPIHNNVAQSNAPRAFPYQGQSCTVPTMSTNDQMMNNMYVTQPNLPVIIQDIQVKLQKLDLLDNVCDRLAAIERKFDVVDQYIAQLKQTAQIQDKKPLSNDDMRHFHSRISELECSGPRQAYHDCCRQIVCRWSTLYSRIKQNSPNIARP
ncbi:unnamed protein product [Mytilus coruscus]|uniref:Uncharacterized protein n=1 Tax=Mytilus coruscus TaxID=42192 RepID=A0A6J8B351_MYTCO|nr:unnamed protein product [Mytilus coruscus]